MGDNPVEQTAPAAAPPATFQEAPYSAPVGGRADLAASAPEQRDTAPQYPSGASLPSDRASAWSSGSSVAREDPTRPGLASQPASLGGLETQDALATTTSQEGTYVVQPNDSYWVISQKLYGTGAYFRALAQHNRAKAPDPDRLPLGGELLAPDVAELEKAYPDLCPKPAHREANERRALAGAPVVPPSGGRVYVVQEGDNLFNIARYELGKATRWTEIVNLNKDQLGRNLNDLNYLTPGMKLVLPDDRPSVNVGQQPGSMYPR
jgi:nucleoid-associated protein YgaU